jgi:hypothetical protein
LPSITTTKAGRDLLLGRLFFKRKVAVSKDMSTIDSQKLNEVFKAGMDAPGYWRWVFDEPECVYNEANDPPTHRPAGHWEWIPSAQEIFLQQTVAPVAGLFARQPERYSSSKGFRIPRAMLKPVDDSE